MRVSQKPTHRSKILSPVNQKLLNQGKLLLQQGKLDEAASCFNAAIQQQPELATAWFLLGQTRGQQAQHTEAEYCCQEAIRLDDKLVGAHLRVITESGV